MDIKKVRVGDVAPDFTLPDQTGAPVALHDLLGGKTLVVYFYPKDQTPGCTIEARAFRDSYDAFTSADAEVIGVSSDSADRHAGFASKHRLPFTLLADQGGRVRKAYGVPTVMALKARIPAAADPLSPSFWFVMSMGLLVGFIIAYPMNWWLVAHHLKHGMMTVRRPSAAAMAGPAHAGMDMAPQAAPAMRMDLGEKPWPPVPVMALLSFLALAAGIAIGLLLKRM